MKNITNYRKRVFTRFFYYIGNAIIELRKCIKSTGIKGIGEAEKIRIK